MICPNSPVRIDAHTEIVCEVHSITFAKITWFHDGQPISKQRRHHVVADWKTCNQTLKIKFAKTTDSGKYTCQVANISATVSKTCNLEVKGKYSFIVSDTYALVVVVVVPTYKAR